MDWIHHGPGNEALRRARFPLLKPAVAINRGPMGAGSNMASQKRVLGSPTSPTPLRRIPPSLLAAQSSSLTGGPSSSYPVTTPSYQSSPDPPSTQSRSSQSPDLLDDFRYSPTMAGDFQRLDAEVAAIRGDNPSPPPSTIASASSLSSPTPPQDQKTWVVFRGKGPGLYNSS